MRRGVHGGFADFVESAPSIVMCGIYWMVLRIRDDAGEFQSVLPALVAGFAFERLLAMVFALDALAAEAREGIEEANENGGIVAQSLVEGSGIKISEKIRDDGGGHKECGFVDVAVGIFAEEVQGQLVPVVNRVEPLALLKPVLVTAVVPVGEIVLSEGFSVGAELLENSGVREAVLEQLIEPGANGFRQARDLALASKEGRDVWDGSDGR